jgi:hypothetical protein
VRRFLIVLAVVPLLVPAAASADDRSLREAGRSRDAEFSRLGKAARAAYRAWNDSGRLARPARRVIRILRRTRGEIELVQAALAAQQPSSDNGATYKRLLLMSLGEFDRALAFEVGGVGAATAGPQGLPAHASARLDGCTGAHFGTGARRLRRSSRCSDRASRAGSAPARGRSAENLATCRTFS